MLEDGRTILPLRETGMRQSFFDDQAETELLWPAGGHRLTLRRAKYDRLPACLRAESQDVVAQRNGKRQGHFAISSCLEPVFERIDETV
jgi:hypothetical protein